MLDNRDTVGNTKTDPLEAAREEIRKSRIAAIGDMTREQALQEMARPFAVKAKRRNDALAAMSKDLGRPVPTGIAGLDPSKRIENYDQWAKNQQPTQRQKDQAFGDNARFRMVQSLMDIYQGNMPRTSPMLAATDAIGAGIRDAGFTTAGSAFSGVAEAVQDVGPGLIDLGDIIYNLAAGEPMPRSGMLYTSDVQRDRAMEGMYGDREIPAGIRGAVQNSNFAADVARGLTQVGLMVATAGSGAPANAGMLARSRWLFTRLGPQAIVASQAGRAGEAKGREYDELIDRINSGIRDANVVFEANGLEPVEEWDKSRAKRFGYAIGEAGQTYAIEWLGNMIQSKYFVGASRGLNGLKTSFAKGDGAKEFAIEMAKAVGISGGAEGAEEFAQEFISQILTHMMTPGEQEIDWESAFYSAGVGATVGALFGGGSTYLGSRTTRNRYREITEADALNEYRNGKSDVQARSVGSAAVQRIMAGEPRPGDRGIATRFAQSLRRDGIEIGSVTGEDLADPKFAQRLYDAAPELARALSSSDIEGTRQMAEWLVGKNGKTTKDQRERFLANIKAATARGVQSDAAKMVSMARQRAEQLIQMLGDLVAGVPENDTQRDSFHRELFLDLQVLRKLEKVVEPNSEASRLLEETAAMIESALGTQGDPQADTPSDPADVDMDPEAAEAVAEAVDDMPVDPQTAPIDVEEATTPDIEGVEEAIDAATEQAQEAAEDPVEASGPEVSAETQPAPEAATETPVEPEQAQAEDPPATDGESTTEQATEQPQDQQVDELLATFTAQVKRDSPNANVTEVEANTPIRRKVAKVIESQGRKIRFVETDAPVSVDAMISPDGGTVVIRVLPEARENSLTTPQKRYLLRYGYVQAALHELFHGGYRDDPQVRSALLRLWSNDLPDMLRRAEWGVEGSESQVQEESVILAAVNMGALEPSGVVSLLADTGFKDRLLDMARRVGTRLFAKNNSARKVLLDAVEAQIKSSQRKAKTQQAKGKKAGKSKPDPKPKPKPRTKPKPSEQASTEPRDPLKPAASGRASRIRVPEYGDLNIKYVAVEVDDLEPSHIPTLDYANGFKVNPRGDANERPYDDRNAGRSSRETVVGMVGNWRSDEIYSDASVATVGPPVVDSDGVVLGGNARTMGTLLEYQREGNEVKAATVEAAERFGLDRDAVAGMKKPVIVRVVEGEFKRGELSRALNYEVTTGKTSEVDALSIVNAMDADTLESVASVASRFDTVAEFLSDAAATTSALGTMREAGAISQAQFDTIWSRTAQKVTPEGKAKLEMILLAMAVPDIENLQFLPASIKAKILKSLPHLIRARRFIGDSWQQSMSNAIEGIVAMDARGGYRDVREFIEQMSLDPLPVATDPHGIRIMRVLREEGPRKFLGKMRSLTEAILGDGQDSLMGEDISPEAVFRAEFQTDIADAVESSTGKVSFQQRGMKKLYDSLAQEYRSGPVRSTTLGDLLDFVSANVEDFNDDVGLGWGDAIAGINASGLPEKTRRKTVQVFPRDIREKDKISAVQLSVFSDPEIVLHELAHAITTNTTYRLAAKAGADGQSKGDRYLQALRKLKTNYERIAGYDEEIRTKDGPGSIALLLDVYLQAVDQYLSEQPTMRRRLYWATQEFMDGSDNSDGSYVDLQSEDHRPKVRRNGRAVIPVTNVNAKRASGKSLIGQHQSDRSIRYEGKFNYEISNLDEFIAGAMANTAFRQWLNNTPYKGGKRSLWKRFVEAIQGIIGLPVKQGSLLEQALSSIEGIVFAEDRIANVPLAEVANQSLNPGEQGSLFQQRMRAEVAELDRRFAEAMARGDTEDAVEAIHTYGMNVSLLDPDRYGSMQRMAGDVIDGMSRNGKRGFSVGYSVYTPEMSRPNGQNWRVSHFRTTEGGVIAVGHTEFDDYESARKALVSELVLKAIQRNIKIQERDGVPVPPSQSFDLDTLDFSVDRPAFQSRQASTAFGDSDRLVSDALYGKSLKQALLSTPKSHPLRGIATEMVKLAPRSTSETIIRPSGRRFVNYYKYRDGEDASRAVRLSPVSKYSMLIHEAAHSYTAEVVQKSLLFAAARAKIAEAEGIDVSEVTRDPVEVWNGFIRAGLVPLSMRDSDDRFAGELQNAKTDLDKQTILADALLAVMYSGVPNVLRGGDVVRGIESIRAADAYESMVSAAMADKKTPEPVRRLLRMFQNAKMSAPGVGSSVQPDDNIGSSQGRFESGIEYGLSNPLEFIAQVFSNESFREWMNGQPGDGKKSMWRTFVEIVSRILGVKDGSMLESVIDVSAELSEVEPSSVRFQSRQRMEKYNPNLPTVRDKTFVSALRQAIEDAPAKAMKPDGWRQYIRSLVSKGTVKADEVEWSGIMEEIDALESLWKQISKGGYTDPGVLEEFHDSKGRIHASIFTNKPFGFVTLDEIQYGDVGTESGVVRNLERTRYQNYALGETSPYAEDGRILRQDRSSYMRYEEVTLSAPGATSEDDQYTSPHFFERNIVAHARYSVREDGDRTTLFVDEIQSDWAQEGRQRGFRDPGGHKPYFVIPLTAQRFSDDQRPAWFGSPEGKRLLEDTDATKSIMSLLDEQTQSRFDSVEGVIAEINGIMSKVGVESELLVHANPTWDGRSVDQVGGIVFLKSMDGSMYPLMEVSRRQRDDLPAPGPFVDSTSKWVTLALKRIIARAVDIGADSITLPTGKAVQERVGGQIEGHTEFYEKIVPAALKKLLKKMGSDAKIDESGMDIGSYTVDITQEMREAVYEGLPMFQQRIGNPQVSLSAWSRFRSSIVWEFTTLERAMRQLVEREGYISGEDDPLALLQNSPGWVARDNDNFERREMAPLQRSLRKAAKRIFGKQWKSKIAEFEMDVSQLAFLRHLPYVLAQIRRLKHESMTKAQTKKEITAALAMEETVYGLDESEAYRMIDVLEQKYGNEIGTLEALGEQVRKINARTLDLLHAEGIVSDKVYLDLKTKYPKYVPVQVGFMSEDERTQFVGASTISQPANQLRKLFGGTESDGRNLEELWAAQVMATDLDRRRANRKVRDNRAEMALFDLARVGRLTVDGQKLATAIEAPKELRAEFQRELKRLIRMKTKEKGAPLTKTEIHDLVPIAWEYARRQIQQRMGQQLSNKEVMRLRANKTVEDPVVVADIDSLSRHGVTLQEHSEGKTQKSMKRSNATVSKMIAAREANRYIYRKGDELFLRINDKTLSDSLLLRTPDFITRLANDDDAKASTLARAYLGAFNTRKWFLTAGSPMFWLREFVRQPFTVAANTERMARMYGIDREEALRNLRLRSRIPVVSSLAKLWPIIPTIMMMAGKKKARRGWQREFVEMLDKGGVAMSQIWNSADMDNHEQKMMRAIARARGGDSSSPYATRRQIFAVLRSAVYWTAMVPTAVDMLNRYEAYRAIKLSTDGDVIRAGQVARESTIDFSKKAGSELGKFMNTWTTFFRAAVQGGDQLVKSFGLLKTDPKALLNPRQAAAFATRPVVLFILSSFILELITEMFLDCEENPDDCIPDYQRNDNWVIPIPPRNEDGKVATVMIPKPYGFRVFANIGARAARIMLGKENPTTSVVDTFAEFAGQVGPVAIPDKDRLDIVNIMAPLAGSLGGEQLVRLGINRDWRGMPIYMEPFGEDGTMDSRRAMRDTPEFWQKAARILHSVTATPASMMPGADRMDYLDSGVDVAPESLQYLTEGVIGTPARWLGFMSEIITNPEEELGRYARDVDTRPVIRVFTSQTGSARAIRQSWSEVSRQYKVMERDIKDAEDDRDEQQRRLDGFGAGARGYGTWKAAERALRSRSEKTPGLYMMLRRAREAGNAERANQISDYIVEVQREALIRIRSQQMEAAGAE